jgi:hypothetical protein
MWAGYLRRALSGAVVVLTREAVTDIPTMLIALATLGLLLHWPRPPFATIHGDT